MYENNELLYTQEDMDEWMRTCQNLQEHLNEQEEEIRELKKQMKEKDKGIYNLLDQNEEQTYKFANIVGETARLENIITEKDKQIKYLEKLCDKERLKTTELQQQIRGEKTMFDMYRANTIQKGIADPEATKIIRKQVCDEIKKELSKDYPYFDWEDMKDSYLYDISGKEIYDVLDQIEKGEE